MPSDIVKSVRSVFLHPVIKSAHGNLSTDRKKYHGRESSASTGRFAALLFPFELVLSEPNLIALSTTGASTSMSSSKSDMFARLYNLNNEILESARIRGKYLKDERGKIRFNGSRLGDAPNREDV
jgi:hypothetical protein